MGWLRLLPFTGILLLGLVWLARLVVMRASSLVIESDGITIRNWPRRARRFPLSAVDRFDETAREGAWEQVRLVAGALILMDGTEVPVRSLGDPEVNRGVTGLNNRLIELRGPRA